ncbi:hypothetical protein WICPIJ_004484 [Wickerhamomyces pijperi]|uniref:GATA-type domain-containing protein n=1 Tax=Wickerhamomyces pijperi TaxID=599730 RepID=A0A9P8Q5W3_WICPI|nr:hypothetical protein WICPIJ_004484 [Wickerhamomyces pijperi]
MNTIVPSCSKCFTTDLHIDTFNTKGERVCESCKENDTHVYGNLLNVTGKNEDKDQTATNVSKDPHVNPYLQMLNNNYQAIFNGSTAGASVDEGCENVDSSLLRISPTSSDHSYVSISGYCMDKHDNDGDFTDITSTTYDLISQFNEGKTSIDAIIEEEHANEPVSKPMLTSSTLDTDSPDIKKRKISRLTPEYQKSMEIQCSNCHRIHSYTWYYVKTPYPRCATCYQYEHKHDGKPRPVNNNNNNRANKKPTARKKKAHPAETRKVGICSTNQVNAQPPIKQAKPKKTKTDQQLPTLSDLGITINVNTSLKSCVNCHTDSSSVWYRAEVDNGYICTACYQYKRKYSVDRPGNVFKAGSENDNIGTLNIDKLGSVLMEDLAAILQELIQNPYMLGNTYNPE